MVTVKASCGSSWRLDEHKQVSDLCDPTRIDSNGGTVKTKQPRRCFVLCAFMQLK